MLTQAVDTNASRRPAVTIAVIERAGVWRLVVDGEAVGRFKQRSDAVRCALDVANDTRSGGRAVELLAQDGSGDLRPAEVASFTPKASGGKALS